MNAPKQIEVEVIKNQIMLHFIGALIPPTKKALKENGFTNRKGTYVAEITAQNKFFVKLLTGYAI